MKKPNVKKLTQSMLAGLDKRSPEILMGIGIAGMITATVLAVKATPKALKLIEDKKDELKADSLTPVETVKTTWKCYIPAVVTGCLSTVCIVGSNSVHTKRTAALATAYKISETALTEYKEKVLETLGEKKEKEIVDEIAKDHVQQNPVSKNEVIITNKGDTLCYDPISGRYFKSDIGKIEKAINDLNRDIINDNYVSLNEYYEAIGLSYIDIGSDLGWNVDALIDVHFSYQGADDGTPCLSIEHNHPPKYNYYKLF